MLITLRCSGVTGRSLSQAFGLATVLDYHRRAADLNRWAACSMSKIRCF